MAFPPASWSPYYDAVAGKPPMKTLVDAADRFAAEGDAQRSAVDLGCGTGRDTLELLRRGWRVLAIDADEDGMRRMREAAGAHPQLTTRVSRIEDASWGAVDLVNATSSLFFVPPRAFDATWERIIASIKPGGRFSGNLLGDRDTWASVATMTHQTLDEARRLLGGLQLELFEEVDDPQARTATGVPTHRHGYLVVARKPS